MIRGMHAMFYSSSADELRAFLRDKLLLSGTDVGGGWLIFDAPEADRGRAGHDGAGRSADRGLRGGCARLFDGRHRAIPPVQSMI